LQIGNTLKVPVTGKVTGSEEKEAIIRVAEENHFSPGKYVEQFEHEFAKFIGKRYALFVNSGSSANLLAVAGFKKYSELVNRVFLPAVTFPTTINPYIQHNYEIELVDINLETLQADMAFQDFGVHTLGNYSEINILEDSCDAMFPNGYKGLAQTFSFYPAHFLTTAEGGMVTTDNAKFYTIMKSIRDWGRSCHCDSGIDNTCGKRFSQQFGDMPYGYDHKYIYSNIGYNLNGTEFSAAMGIEQLKKLPEFLNIRKRNFAKLYTRLSKYSEMFVLPKTVIPDTAWFSFPLTIKSDAKFNRLDIINYLDKNGIGSRPIMAGNIARQPAYKDTKFIINQELKNSNIVTENSFYIGCWHGLSEEQIEYTINVFDDFIEDIYG